jgi:pimeloyl-ACP methyl ester carboxylesterase
LGSLAAHFAGRGSADLQGFASRHPERMASLTLLCPAVLDTRTLAPLAGRLLVVTGDHGPGARRVRAGLRDLPQAVAVVLGDYAGRTWADIAGERGDSIGAAMQKFLSRPEALRAAGLPEQEGEIAGISYRLRGAGPPLVLLATRSVAVGNGSAISGLCNTTGRPRCRAACSAQLSGRPLAPLVTTTVSGASWR